MVLHYNMHAHNRIAGTFQCRASFRKFPGGGGGGIHGRGAKAPHPQMKPHSGGSTHIGENCFLRPDHIQRLHLNIKTKTSFAINFCPLYRDPLPIISEMATVYIRFHCAGTEISQLLL